jgi:hypothetical protein
LNPDPFAAVVPISAAGRRYRVDRWNCWKRRNVARDHGDLLALFDGSDIEAFLGAAVRARLTILLSGATGCNFPGELINKRLIGLGWVGHVANRRYGFQ